MTDGVVHDPRAASLALLDGLVRRGRELMFASEHARPEPVDGRAGPLVVRQAHHERDGVHPAEAEVRIWQRDCAAAINELSGGNKSHWLSRAYSSALLVRSTEGEAVVEADAGEIVRRVLDVLEQARQSLISMDTAAPYSADAQEPHRFDFVHDPNLRPVLEGAFVDGRRAFEEGDYKRAMMTACGILEAIITDRLVRLKPDATTGRDVAASAGAAIEFVRGVRLQPDLLAMSFDERIAAAEGAGLIRGGCARLPAAARAYRDAFQPAAISEREATVTRQVLHVVMRDLDPGR
jgi:hypothetical protein